MFKELLISAKSVWLSTVLLWLTVWVVGYCAYILIPIEHELHGFPWFTDNNFIQTARSTWDTLFFTRIAEGGYLTNIDHIGDQDYLLAFFPLFPALIALFSLFAGTFGFLLASLFSTLLLATTLRWVLTKLEVPEVWQLSLLVPGSVFFFLPYTEALFCALLVLLIGVLLFYQERLVLIATLSILLALTRSVAVFFVLALGAVFLFQMIQKKSLFTLKAVLASGFGVAIGVGAVFVVNQILTGSWRTALDVQAYWGRSIQGGSFFEPFSRAIIETIGGNPSFSLAYLVLVVGVFWLVFTKVRGDHRLFTIWLLSAVLFVVTIVSSVSQNTLQSVNRYAVANPLFLLLVPVVAKGYVGKKWFDVVLLLLILVLLASSFLFFRHRWVG